MKQLLFLLLFPCLALAQYTGNAGQKITLGEQTTADGLVYRGLESIDTVTATSKITRANKQDTSAFLLLDTVTNLLWHYKTASNGWIQAGGGVSVSSFSAGTTGLTPSTATTGAVTLAGTLGVANGGTGITSLGSGVATFLGTPSSANLASAVTNETGSGELVFATSPTIKTAKITGGNGDQLFITNEGENFTQVNFGQNSSYKTFLAIDHRSGFKGFVFGNQGSETDYRKVLFRTNGTVDDMIITNSEVWIGYTSDQGAYALQINGTPQATGALYVTSDEKFKENITPLNKGLEIVNKLKPVTYNFISDTKNNFSVNEEVGFIAQDVDRALSTETFAKSIVNSADDSDPTLTMGLATQNLIPILVKAIQEQNALIKALEQRILTLENK